MGTKVGAAAFGAVLVVVVASEDEVVGPSLVAPLSADVELQATSRMR